jgi:hypothetical protein
MQAKHLNRKDCHPPKQARLLVGQFWHPVKQMQDLALQAWHLSFTGFHLAWRLVFW